MSKLYLSLGSNIEPRLEHLRKALIRLDALPFLRRLAVSSVYETAPVGFTEQAPFLNMAAAYESSAHAVDILQATQAIEDALGRLRSIHWGPRTIDIDLIAYGAQHLDEPGLRIPHPHAAERAFVLVPLAEICTENCLDGRSPESLLATVGRTGVVWKMHVDSLGLDRPHR